MDIIKIEFEAGYLVLTDENHQKTRYPVAPVLRAEDIPALGASKITTEQLALARGGTGVDLSATGGVNQILKQVSVGGAVSVAVLVSGDIPVLDAAKITTGRFIAARLLDGTAGYFLKAGGAGIDPTYVLLVAGDIPALDTAKITTGTFPTARVADLAITKPKVSYTSVAVSVAAAATSGASVADATLVGGEILGVYPTGNQDQLVDNVVLGADGAVTVTLAAAATAANTFKVVVIKP